MSKVRMQRVSAQMKHVVSTVITQELKDPRAGFITVVDAVVAPDLKTARIDFSVLGTENQKKTAARALDSARGYIQARVADEMLLKYTPVITFRLDESIELDLEMQHKIEQAVESDKRAAGARDIRAKIAAGSIPAERMDALAQTSGSTEFLKYIEETLAAVSAKADSPAQREAKVFDAIEKKFGGFNVDAACERIPFDAGIKTDPDYLPPAETKEGVTPEKFYDLRSNLNIVLPSTSEETVQRLILHANVETPEQVATVVAAFKLATLSGKLPGPSCAQFAIEAPDTGNGTLCLALQDAFPFTGLVLCRPTGLHICIPGRHAEHGVAPLREPDMALDVYAIESAKRFGIDAGAPQPCVSRDAGIFYELFRDRDLISFGAGTAEQTASVDEIAQAAKVLAVLIMEYAGPYA